MFRSRFVPAQSSRHRTAALALYRALLKTGRKIPLPENLQQRGPVHPVVHLVKKRFAKNDAYTSLRLVYASMAAGYKFLTIFTDGQTPNSPEHKQIVRYLQARSQQAETSRSKAPSPESEITDYDPPLLSKISRPSEPPKYISTVRPRPRSELQGERKVPHVVATAEGVPFLRAKKPQPRALSRSIGKKTKVLLRKVYKVADIEDELMPNAHAEDNWDRLVNKQMKSEGLEVDMTRDGPLETYYWPLHLARIWLNRQINATWVDFVARGRALQKIVEDEKACAEQEKLGHTGLEINTAPKGDTTISQKPDTKHDQTTPTFEDPFLSKEWAARVRREEERRRKPNDRNSKEDEEDGLLDMEQFKARLKA